MTTPLCIIMTLIYLNSTAFNCQTQNDINIIDTLQLKGCLIVYTSKKSDDMNVVGYKLFFVNADSTEIINKRISKILNEKYIYIDPVTFLRMAQKSNNKDNYKGLSVDKNKVIKDHRKLVAKNKRGNIYDYYFVNTKFIVSLIKQDFYEKNIGKSDDCSNGYIKAIIPMSFGNN